MKQCNLLLEAMRQPESLLTLNLAEWDMLLRQARHAGLLARIGALLAQRGLMDQVPSQAREHFLWSRAVAQRHTQAVRWEVTQIRHALQAVGLPIILLKGAAYVMANLSPADGRLFSDIDIMVPKVSLDAVEAALMLHGWTATHHDPYDQRYYRSWMHELPPMQHIKREAVIDVHHTILPESAAVHPDPAKLRAAACPVEGYSDLQVLGPIDMVLHSATHLFYEAELDHGLRDLVDLDSLLRQFGALPLFWSGVVGRAQELELTRPLFYALRYTASVLHTPIPAEVMHSARVGAPSRLTLALMDRIFQRIFSAPHPLHAGLRSFVTRQMLYVRGHWLRMPPLMLARHLLHKAFVSPDPE